MTSLSGLATTRRTKDTVFLKRRIWRRIAGKRKKNPS
jgi:hypothetical protein